MDGYCLASVDSYLQRYSWGLISRDMLLAQVTREYQQREADGPETARAAVLWCYSAIMYSACSGAEGRARQDQGYSEIYSFLAASARRRYNGYATEAVQRAVGQIFAGFASCQRPETFLAFALQKLRDAARAELRTLQRDAEALPENESGMAAAQPLTAPASRSDPADEAAHNDLLCQVRHSAQHFIQQNPRAAQQITALWMRHIEGLDDSTIGQRLGTSEAAVQVMRSRAAQRLRREPDWQLLAADLGILPAGVCES